MRRFQVTIDERIEGLQGCSLFEGLSAAELGILAEAARPHAYAAGETLFTQHAPADGFHIVTGGELRVYRCGTDGREQVLHVFGPGTVCGEAPVFEGTTYPATAEALCDLQTLYIARVDFMDLAREQPELLLRMLALLAKRLRHFVDLVDDLSLKDVASRLARYLLDEADGSSTIELKTTKTMLAATIGTIPETLSRTFKRMQRQGLITVNAQRIEVLDRASLEALARGENPRRGGSA